MKFIITTMLLLSAILSYGQQQTNGGFIIGGIDNNNAIHYFGNRPPSTSFVDHGEDTVYYDTTKIMMLCADTTERSGTRMPMCFWLFGYELIQRVRGNRIHFITQESYILLGENKKPIPNGIVVWDYQKIR